MAQNFFLGVPPISGKGITLFYLSLLHRVREEAIRLHSRLEPVVFFPSLSVLIYGLAFLLIQMRYIQAGLHFIGMIVFVCAVSTLQSETQEPDLLIRDA